jgi:hypothetical protein
MQSSNALIYADYQMLNIICDNWSGLIIGNYDTVLPLPWRKKLGIRYLYAPAFIQQLGCFGNLSGLDMQGVWDKVFSFAKYGDLFFNYTNKSLLSEIAFIEKNNFIIELNQSYPIIRLGYQHDLIKNLKKSEKQNLQYSNVQLIGQCINLYQTQYQERFPQYRNQDFHRFLKLCLTFSVTGNCITRTVFAENTAEIISSAVLLKNHNRLYLLMNVTTKKGRSMAANHYLLDQIIQEFSEENLVFDFEGSERKGIQEFYLSFQPENQPYFQVSFNKLPAWLNWIRSKFFIRNN